VSCGPKDVQATFAVHLLYSISKVKVTQEKWDPRVYALPPSGVGDEEIEIVLGIEGVVILPVELLQCLENLADSARYTRVLVT
jgi:hypothetical protein